MSIKSALSSAWRVVSKDPGVVVGAVQIVVAVTEIVIRQLSPDDGQRRLPAKRKGRH
jgi:hypothetical protein